MEEEESRVTSLSGWPNRGKITRLPLLVMQARNRPSAVHDMSAIQNDLPI